MLLVPDSMNLSVAPSIMTKVGGNEAQDGECLWNNMTQQVLIGSGHILTFGRQVGGNILPGWDTVHFQLLKMIILNLNSSVLLPQLGNIFLYLISWINTVSV